MSVSLNHVGQATGAAMSAIEPRTECPNCGCLTHSDDVCGHCYVGHPCPVASRQVPPGAAVNVVANGRDASGKCTECKSPAAAYHSRRCSHFRGYHCDRCDQTYWGEYCGVCPEPWWVSALDSHVPPVGQVLTKPQEGEQ